MTRARVARREVSPGQGGRNMGAASWTMGCLLLLGQIPSDATVTNQRGYQFPLNIDPARMKDFKEIRLFISRNQGATWERVDQIRPEQMGFEYHAQEDGLYWFGVAVVDQQGQQVPASPSQ